MTSNVKRKTRFSYIIQDKDQQHQSTLHRQGINALAIDTKSFVDGEGGILYTGARDSIINSWSLNLDISTRNSSVVPGEKDLNATITYGSDSTPSRRFARKSDMAPTSSSSLPSKFNSSFGALSENVDTSDTSAAARSKARISFDHGRNRNHSEANASIPLDQAQKKHSSLLTIGYDKQVQYNLRMLVRKQFILITASHCPHLS